ncbi:unnamed protein product, partial [Nesidiocoris tenuis]
MKSPWISVLSNELKTGPLTISLYRKEQKTNGLDWTSKKNAVPSRSIRKRSTLLRCLGVTPGRGKEVGSPLTSPSMGEKSRAEKRWKELERDGRGLQRPIPVEDRTSSEHPAHAPTSTGRNPDYMNAVNCNSQLLHISRITQNNCIRFGSFGKADKKGEVAISFALLRIPTLTYGQFRSSNANFYFGRILKFCTLSKAAMLQHWTKYTNLVMGVSDAAGFLNELHNLPYTS